MWNHFTIFLIFTSVFAGKEDWWRYATIYEVFLPSFQDSNGDGFGDLRGVIYRLDHFVEVGVNALWLTPFYKTPMAAFGYDVANYTEVDPRFGTFADFQELQRQTKKRGLKLIMDFTPNHSSDKHPWFQKSIKKIKPYTDYYVWRDPKYYDAFGKPIEPNNWLTVYGASAWTWNQERKQFYLNQFTSTLPDLNLRNSKVVKDIKDAIKFWLNHGVDGVRLDAACFLVEDALFRDEPWRSPEAAAAKYKYGDDLIHIHTRHQPETFEILRNIRKELDTEYNGKNEYTKIILLEAYGSTKEEAAYYGNRTYPISHVPLNFLFSILKGYVNAIDFNSAILDWLKHTPEGSVPNWQTENHDSGRFSTKFSTEYANVFAVAITLLPGITILFQGQEIGMTNGIVRPDQLEHTEYVSRSPMQWENSLNAGFTSHRKPWFPVHPNYWQCNVENEKLKENSNYNFAKQLLKIKKTRVAKFGDFHSYIISPWVHAFTRTYKRHTLVIVSNLGTETEIIDLHSEIDHLSPKLRVLIGTPNSGCEKGDQINTRAVPPDVFALPPISSVVLLSR